ncbi:MAG: hypothetical protein M3R06_05570 [Chloroflexota bacterium]|nr:hypothetical protein [Chloroflexota bacterium]
MFTSESERRTRGERIDPRLRQAGWTIVPYDPKMNVSNLSATAIKEYPTETGPAGNMPKINQNVLREVPVPLPPSQVRRQIVTKLDYAMALSEAVGQRTDTALARVDRPLQGILAKAFRGELLPPEVA